MWFTTVDERVASLCLWVGGRVLTVVCTYAPNKSSEDSPLWSPWMIQSNPAGDSLILLGDLSGEIVGNDTATLNGVTGRTGSSWML